MSKQSFCEKNSIMMLEKLYALDRLDLKSFFSNIEDLEFILCLSYLSLSKEKIIKKDKTNDDQLDRLTLKVAESEVDKVFDSSFCPHQIQIISASNNNHKWLLDNIRDSIMHGLFELDEEQKTITINNTLKNRELEAIIPFEWIIAYAKNDIATKRITTDFTYQKVFYNQANQGKKVLKANIELYQTIFFEVNINNGLFNTYEINNKIDELFKQYSSLAVPEDKRSYYEEQITNLSENHIKHLETENLIKFLYIKDLVTLELQKQYPHLSINISLMSKRKKNKIIKKLKSKLTKYTFEYDTFLYDLRFNLNNKSDNLLAALSSMISKLDLYENTDFENKQSNPVEVFNYLIDDNLKGYKIPALEFKYIFYKTFNILTSILINTFGISTLVINQNEIYSPYFLNKNPSDGDIGAFFSDIYLKYRQKLRGILMKKLELETFIYGDENLLKTVPTEKVQFRTEVTNRLAKNKIELTKLEQEHRELINNVEIVQLNYNNASQAEERKIRDSVNSMMQNFYLATKVSDKKKIIKVIGRKFDYYTEATRKYEFGISNDMTAIINTIRNCFSHLGRVTLHLDSDGKYQLYFVDYDDKGNKSAIIVMPLNALIYIISEPVNTPKLS